MKAVQKTATVLAFALSALAFLAMGNSPAQAGPIVPRGHYCLTYDIGGSDCSFTSYAQCQATASGQDAMCYGETVQDDESSLAQNRRGFDARAQIR